MKKIVLAAMLVAAVAVPALPQYYDNGPTNGTVDAWAINYGFVVSNTFTFYWPSPVYLLSFEAWLFPGDVLQSAEVSITSSEFGGSTYFDANVNFTQASCTMNQYGFDVCLETGILGSPVLNAGTYWLNLQHAIVPSGNPVYWDENSGPSRASESSVGTIPSESFTISNGCYDGKISPGCGPPPQAPEPTSLAMFASGVIAAFGVVRRLVR